MKKYLAMMLLALFLLSSSVAFAGAGEPPSPGNAGDANGNDDKAHWHEREEAERLIASLGQHLVDDKVGRSTDKRKHSA